MDNEEIKDVVDEGITGTETPEVVDEETVSGTEDPADVVTSEEDEG